MTPCIKIVESFSVHYGYKNCFQTTFGIFTLHLRHMTQFSPLDCSYVQCQKMAAQIMTLDFDRATCSELEPAHIVLAILKTDFLSVLHMNFHRNVLLMQHSKIALDWMSHCIPFITFYNYTSVGCKCIIYANLSNY